MMLTKLLQRLQIQFSTKLPNNDFYLNVLFYATVLAFIGIAVWVLGPYLSFGNFAPLAQREKRIYIILFVCLAWLLKFLITDLDAPNPFHQDAQTRKKLQTLLKRFHGAVAFLKRKKTLRHGKSVSLNELPWYLLIGPDNAGKTTLLANSGVHFILQRQLNKDSSTIIPSESCDWWVTHEASIIDVPGKYLANPIKTPDRKIANHPTLWSYFLKLIKQQRGKNGISGIIIALPIPELMKEGEAKKFQLLQKKIFQRLQELQTFFSDPLPCQIIITKCDLLKGFNEFFSESSNDEINQVWGIALPKHQEEKIYDLFTQRFNALIRKLNRQLLWRLHHERNPESRIFIKDFPYQVERLKEFIYDFIKKGSEANLHLAIQGVYLTSATQNIEAEAIILDEDIHSNQRAVQIFQEPRLPTRSYFIKQFLTLSFSHPPQSELSTDSLQRWKHRLLYAASVGIIGVASLLLIKDFQRGMQHTYQMQNHLTNYQSTVQQVHDIDEHLIKTITLLNTMQQSTYPSKRTLDLSYLLSFYSHKSIQKANNAYHQALQTILLPEIKNYFEEFLKLPVNRNPEYVYAVFKAYLMLGDPSHLQPSFVVNTLQEILTKQLDENQISQCAHHLTLALNSMWNPLILDPSLIQQTRTFLTSMTNYQLGYIILKNTSSNSIETKVDIGTSSDESAILVSRQIPQLPAMFTAQSFVNIISNEVTLASQEAMQGNWVLGNHSNAYNPEETMLLIEQLRTAYISNYVDAWERLVANIYLKTPKNLIQTDQMIVRLISNQSPLLQLLQTLHDNTFFEPIASSSPRLQSLGVLVEKNQPEHLLYEIFTKLQSLHLYIQSVLTATDENKAAFEIMSKRMKNITPDAITQIRIIADKSPEPIKSWLRKIGNDTWYYLMQDAGRYIDFSWQNQVIHAYQTDIANRYPFSTSVEQEVELQKFVRFFGNPGIVLNFYNQYLQPFVDTSTPDWNWKATENGKLPFSENALRQIQHAIRVHQAFFPNGDDKLHVQFALQPYHLGKRIKSVSFRMNNKQIIDRIHSAKAPHVLSWPRQESPKITTVQLTMANLETIDRHYPGDWGWFQLVDQSFESVISKKELLLNFSIDKQPAKYLLFTEGKINPFTSLNLTHFQLPQRLMDNKG